MAYQTFYQPYQQMSPYGQPYQSPYQPVMQPQMQNTMTSPMQQTQITATQQNGNGTIWVQGEEGAKAYLLAPGNTVVLWDSENQTIYIKSADQSGIPSMRILDWTERTNAPKQSNQTHTVTQPQISLDNYVTREEFDALAAELAAMKSAKSGSKKQTAKEDAENG